MAAAIAEMEGAESGLAFATGMAAIHAALVSTVRAGQTIVATRAVYGTTRDLMTRVLAGLGIATEFVDPTDPAAVDAALAKTGAPVLYVETISNPTIVVSDIAALAGIAHRRGALLLVDNTFASPYACRPIEHGADLVMHSATKYLSGHADVLAGVVVGSRERIDAVRPILVDAGGALAPLAAFLVLRGLPTLALRMERHSETALELAAWLTGQDAVERVHYPGLPADPNHATAVKQLDVFGGMLAFELAGGREAGRAFLDAMRLAERTASLGAFRTITTHPPSTTHRQLDAAALAASGIAPGLLRCSVGLEDVEDLREDFELGLAAAGAVGGAAGK
jgi:methionine-gamma-lyase